MTNRLVNKLKDAFRKNKLTYKKVAVLLGCPHGNVVAFMCSGTRIRNEYWNKLVEMTKGDVTLNDFFEEYGADV